MYILPREAVKEAKANRISETCAYFHAKYDKKFYDLVINGEVVRDNPYL